MNSALFKNATIKKLIWSLAVLAILLLLNLIFTREFFHIQIRYGYLYGTLIDILNHGLQVMVLAIGMTLAIAILVEWICP